MSILANLTTDNSIEPEVDSVGSGFRILDSGLYDLTIETAYVEVSSGGATGLNLSATTEDGATVRQTLWMTSGTAKGGKNYYERDGKKNYLPGFIAARALCLLTVGKEIAEMDVEEKVIKVYDYDAKKELPTKVNMLVDLIGKEITAGILKQVVDKNVKDASGNYVPSGETREENEIDKLFRKRDGMTVAEILNKAEEAQFKDTWLSKWEGQVKNKAKGTGSVSGMPGKGSPAAAGAEGTTKAATKSLFA